MGQVDALVISSSVIRWETIEPRSSWPVSASRMNGGGDLEGVVGGAPAMRAPWITDWPTSPQPITATIEPGATRAVLTGAPRPVVTPQPQTAAAVWPLPS